MADEPTCLTPTNEFHLADFNLTAHIFKGNHPGLAETRAPTFQARVLAEATDDAQVERAANPGAKAARVEEIDDFFVGVFTQQMVNFCNHLRLGSSYFTVRQWQRQFQSPQSPTLEADLDHELVRLA